MAYSSTTRPFRGDCLLPFAESGTDFPNIAARVGTTIRPLHLPAAAKIIGYILSILDSSRDGPRPSSSGIAKDPASATSGRVWQRWNATRDWIRYSNIGQSVSLCDATQAEAAGTWFPCGTTCAPGYFLANSQIFSHSLIPPHYSGSDCTKLTSPRSRNGLRFQRVYQCSPAASVIPVSPFRCV